MRKNLLAGISLVIVVILSLSLLSCGQQPANTETPTQSQGSTSGSPSVEQLALPTIAGVVANVKPSVVAINVEITTYNIFNQPTQKPRVPGRDGLFVVMAIL